MTRTLLAATLALCLATPAFAQGTVAQPVSGQTNDWPVSKVLGVTVYNGNGDTIGKIQDLLMDPQARVATAILSVGGYLGVGDRLVQVPLDTIRFPKDAVAPSVYPQKAVIATSKETLAGMPPFKYLSPVNARSVSFPTSRSPSAASAAILAASLLVSGLSLFRSSCFTTASYARRHKIQSGGVELGVVAEGHYGTIPHSGNLFQVG